MLQPYDSAILLLDEGPKGTEKRYSNKNLHTDIHSTIQNSAIHNSQNAHQQMNG